jgi:hypothetical protein
MMLATLAGAAGGMVASPAAVSEEASTAREALVPKACSSSRATSASLGAPPRERLAAATSGDARLLPATPGSGGGIYGASDRHGWISRTSPDPQPAPATQAIATARSTEPRTSEYR